MSVKGCEGGREGGGVKESHRFFKQEWVNMCKK